MKLVMDERLKHRLIGIAVIISIATIFAPAMMRKSNQRIERDYSVKVKLPSKPASPDVAVTDESEMFKTIKVARVDIPQVANTKQVSDDVKAETLNPEQKTSALPAAPATSAQQVKESRAQESDKSKEPVKLALNDTPQALAKAEVRADEPPANPAKPVSPALAKPKMNPIAKPVIKPVKAVRTITKVAVRPTIKKEIYALQLASFSRLSNAQALVNRLKSKGYRANFVKLATKNGPVYKVYVGHSPKREDVLRLKIQLASAMQINGFVVNTGVS
jgi:DedD protein